MKATATKQLDPEKYRPNDGQKIIFENQVGLFWGIFNTTKSGVIYVDGNSKDIVDWNEVDWWILYPVEF